VPERGAPEVAGGAREARPADPQVRLQRARDLAWRSLNRRDRTIEEMRRHLAGREIEPAVVDRVLAELREQGYLDDAAYARRFAEDRRRLDAWGAERIERRLLALGVERDHVEAALAEQDQHDELTAAVELLERRFGAPPETRRDRERALGMLLRKGYETELALDALRRFGTAVEVD
jgi:regulatory protein